MTAPTRRLSLPEFVMLMAMLSATIAFSIDAMLPALPRIGAELSPDNPNVAQLVIVSFVFGMGIGTFFAGPLSDAFGRKRVMLIGAGIYCVGAALATIAPTLEMLLAARVLQGLGASGPRVAAQAMIRDLYSGRDMARVSSFVMMTFALVPAIAPLIGAMIIAGFDWRGVFVTFVVFAIVSGGWLALRQPETLTEDKRRPLNLSRLTTAAKEVVAHANVRRAILVQTLVFGILFATISSVQQVYDQSFDRADSFPLWFGLVAIISASASFLNARVVGRLGMIWMIRAALAGFAALSLVLAGVWASGVLPQAPRFPLFVIWQVAAFCLAGLTIGNVQAVAMQPMGHIAGMAASIISAVSTVLAVVIAAPIGLAFDGTPLPLFTGVGVCALLGLWLSARLQEEPAELTDPHVGQKIR